MSKGSGGRPGTAQTGMNPWSSPSPAFGKAQVNGGPGSMGVFTGKPETNGGPRSGVAPMQMPSGAAYGKPEVNVMPQMGPDGPMMSGPMGVPIQRPMREQGAQAAMRFRQENRMPGGQQQFRGQRLAQMPNLMGYRR